MELKTKVNRHSHIAYWVKLWNGGLQLTDKERTFLGEILYRTMYLQDQGIQEPFLGQLVFSTKTMNEIKEKLELSKQGINNYKMALVRKGVIYKDDENVYHVNQRLIPKESITFKFEYDEK